MANVREFTWGGLLLLFLNHFLLRSFPRDTDVCSCSSFLGFKLTVSPSRKWVLPTHTALWISSQSSYSKGLGSLTCWWFLAFAKESQATGGCAVQHPSLAELCQALHAKSMPLLSRTCHGPSQWNVCCVFLGEPEAGGHSMPLQYLNS